MDDKLLAWIREVGFAAAFFYMIIRVDKRLLKISLVLERLCEKAGVRREETTPHDVGRLE